MDKNKRHQGFFYETSFLCFPIPKSSKGGQGHIEIILSFVIFVGFVLFLFIIFNPFKSPMNPGLIDSVYGNLQEELKVNVNSISINLAPVAEMPADFNTKIFFAIDPINGFDCTKENLLVKGRDGEITDSLIVPDTRDIFIELINPPDYETYYTLSCSPEFANTFDGRELQPSQVEELDKDAGHYSLGILTEKDFWSNNSFTSFNTEYHNNYGELKDKIVPKGSDFGLALVDLEGNTIFLMANNVPRSLDVYARTVAVEVLDPSSGVSRKKLEIRVW